MAETITKEEVQNEIQTEVKAVVTESMQVVKKYVDDNSIDNTAKRDALKTEIENAIAEKYDFENEKAKLDQASKVADTLLGLFDADENGEINPQEFLDKLNSIYANLDTTTQLGKDVEAVVNSVKDLQSQIDTKIAEVNGSIKTVSDNVSKAQADIQAVEANLTTNFFTKEEVQSAIQINKDEIVQAVNDVFYPSEDNGDGATL